MRKVKKMLRSQKPGFPLPMLAVTLVAFLTIACSAPMTKSRVTVEPMANDAVATATPEPKLKNTSYCATIAKRLEHRPSSLRVGSDLGPSTVQNRLDALFFGDPVRWKTIRSEDGITSFEDLEASDQIIGFRGQTLIHASLKKVATILSRQDLRAKWVENLAENRVIRINSNFDRVEYTHAKAPWPFQDRDFVYRATISVLKEPHAMMIRMVSVDDPNAPVKSDIVRGEIKRAYYFLRETKEGDTELVVEMAVNPSGVIPKWLTNLTQRQWPHKTLLALRQLATSPDLDVPPEVEQYFSSRE